MRTWFDRTIEWFFIGIAIWSVVAAGQIMVEIANM